MVQNHTSKHSDEQIIALYNSNITLHQAAVELNVTTVTLWRRAKKLNLKWSDKVKQQTTYIPTDEILEGKHPQYQTFKLKNRLIKEGIKENICDECGLTEWNGNPLNMQLDHIDGNPHNHLLENIRFLCPNCHSQTETYCGKGKSK